MRQQRTAIMICLICAGAGECQREARVIRFGMIKWIETQCRCCQATGETTAERLAIYHANRRRDAAEAWQREQRRLELEQRERELAVLELEAA
jgi:hypothetical protein